MMSYMSSHPEDHGTGPDDTPSDGPANPPVDSAVGDPVAWLEAAIAAVGEVDLGVFSAHDCA